MKQCKNYILFFLSFTLLFACTPEELKIMDYSVPYVISSPNVINQGGEIDFVECSQGVVSRTWTFPADGGIVQVDKDWNVIENKPTSSEPTVFLFFNNAGTFGVRFQATFKDPNVTIDTVMTVIVVPYVKAAFESDAVMDNGQRIVYAGESVNYQTTSTGFATNSAGDFTGDYYTWTFEGGTPSTSSAKNPTVQYDYPGSWDVTLIAYRTAPRGSDTIVIRNYITVLPAITTDP